jgi:class 3 adenylate cyclase
MIQPPETQYLKTADGVHIAYQVVGEGPRDIVYLSSWDLGIDFHWDQPDQRHFFDRLASCGRVILFDKRGTGASDAISLDAMPTLESWTDDIVFVMDALRCEQAAVIAPTYSGPLAVMFAATHPARTSALVLVSSFSSILRDQETQDANMAMIETEWGTGNLLAFYYAPSLEGDERMRRWWNRCERLSLSPAAGVAFTTMVWDSDVEPVLPLVQAPTLALHRTEGFYGPFSTAYAQLIANAVANGKAVGYPGPDALPWIGDAVADEITSFLTGAPVVADTNRALATVVFSDIVSSTAKAVAQGDHRWLATLESHEVAARQYADLFRGRLIKCTGDGTLATFDGPARAIRYASALKDNAAELGMEVRCGIHAGEVEWRGEDIGGLAVHIASRVEAQAGPGEVLVSRTVVDLVAGSGIEFADRGEHALKGVPGPWRLFAVRG